MRSLLLSGALVGAYAGLAALERQPAPSRPLGAVDLIKKAKSTTTTTSSTTSTTTKPATKTASSSTYTFDLSHPINSQLTLSP